MGERKYLLPEQGTFYKANLHSHTPVSDGRLRAEEMKQAYMAHGYSILAFTDHRIYRNHQDLDDENFLTIPAVEVDMNEESAERLAPRDKTYHINLFDLRPDYKRAEKEAGICPERRYGDFAYINQYIAKMRELGFLACYNHPYWSMQNYDDYKALQGFFAMEIYNYGCELDGMYGYAPQAYDEMLRTGQKLFCLATDDNHNSFPFDDPRCDSFGGFTMICAEKLDFPSVSAALLAGNFYCSMGPEIRALYIEDGALHVKTSPVKKIYMMNAGKNCPHSLAAEGEYLTEAVFPLKGNEGYVRVELRDEYGRYANSNAYWI